MTERMSQPRMVDQDKDMLKYILLTLLISVSYSGIDDGNSLSVVIGYRASFFFFFSTLHTTGDFGRMHGSGSASGLPDPLDDGCRPRRIIGPLLATVVRHARNLLPPFGNHDLLCCAVPLLSAGQ